MAGFWNGGLMESRPSHCHYDYDVPITIRYPRFSAQNLLWLSANAFPDKLAPYKRPKIIEYRD